MIKILNVYSFLFHFEKNCPALNLVYETVPNKNFQNYYVSQRYVTNEWGYSILVTWDVKEWLVFAEVLPINDGLRQLLVHGLRQE